MPREIGGRDSFVAFRASPWHTCRSRKIDRGRRGRRAAPLAVENRFGFGAGCGFVGRCQSTTSHEAMTAMKALTAGPVVRCRRDVVKLCIGLPFCDSVIFDDRGAPGFPSIKAVAARLILRTVARLTPENGGAGCFRSGTNGSLRGQFTYLPASSASSRWPIAANR